MGLKAELKNRVMYLSLCRMCLLKVCGKHLFVNYPHLATFLVVGEGRKAFGAVEWQLFSLFFWRGRSHLARSWQPGSGQLFCGAQLAAAVRQEPENWLLPQGG